MFVRITSYNVCYTKLLRYGLLGGGAFGPEEGVFTTAVLLLGFLFVKWYYRKSSFDFMAMEEESKEEKGGVSVKDA